MQTEYTVTHHGRFTVDGSKIAQEIEEFSNRWQESPLDLLRLVKEVYLNGVKEGLRLSGHHVKGYKEIDKDAR